MKKTTIAEFTNGTVEIQWTLPTVAVHTNEGSNFYFLQGEEASDMLTEAEQSPLGVEEYILTYFTDAA